MLYSEFLAGANAVDNEASFAEYKRVERIYLESDHCTKDDAYRMANVETVEQHDKRGQAERKQEIEWVKHNIMPAASFVRGMAEINGTIRDSVMWYCSPLGNVFFLREHKAASGSPLVTYDFFVDDDQIDVSVTGYKHLPSAEVQSCYAGWHDRSRNDLRVTFGYIV